MVLSTPFSMVKAEKSGKYSQLPGSIVNSFKTTVLTLWCPEYQREIEIDENSMMTLE